MGKAIMRVSFSLIHLILSLPEGVTITRAEEESETARSFGYLEFQVEHENLPEMPEGIPLPLAIPNFRTGSDGAAEFVDWGLQAEDWMKRPMSLPPTEED